MLTADLVNARNYRGKIKARYVEDDDPDLLALAGRLIETFDAHRGLPRGVLEESLREIQGTDTGFQLHRAFAKLLFDRATFRAEAAGEPETLRRAVFEASAAAWRRAGSRPADDEDAEPAFRAGFDRTAVLDAAAVSMGCGPQALFDGLYADLKDEQVLVAWQRVEPRWLLRRYNVALAQGVLLRAESVRLEMDEDDPLRRRALFRKIKFFRLMHRVTSRPGGFSLHLDGPLSVVRASGKYGLQLATFLPTLLCFDCWTLEAAVRWGRARRRATFELSSTDGLVSPVRLDGQWQPEELQWLPDQLASDTWAIEVGGDLIDLGGEGVLVPDFVFTHRETGRQVVMEVFGFWNRGAVASRLDLLRRHGPADSILALSRALASSSEGLDELPGEVYVYRSKPVARQVREVLRRFETIEMSKLDRKGTE